MRLLISIACVFIMLSGCDTSKSVNQIKVSNSDELNNAIKDSKPGDDIVLTNGVWKDVKIKFRGKGTKDKPITLRAETAGKVSIEGQSYLKFGGEYLISFGDDIMS